MTNYDMDELRRRGEIPNEVEKRREFAKDIIESEKNNNPRLQVNSKEQYAEIMSNLNLANPKMMDVAVPANVKGLTLEQL